MSFSKGRHHPSGTLRKTHRRVAIADGDPIRRHPMPFTKHPISQSEKLAIAGLYSQGVGIAQIAETFRISKSYVTRIAGSLGVALRMPHNNLPKRRRT